MPSLQLDDLSPVERANILARLQRPCKRGHNRDWFYLFRKRDGSISIFCADCHAEWRLRHPPARKPRRRPDWPELRACADAGISQRQAAMLLGWPVGTVRSRAEARGIRFNAKRGRPRKCA